MGENSFKKISFMKINTCYLQRGKSQHRVTYFPSVAFNLFFLRLFSLLIHILLVGLLSVCLFYVFLLLFSDKMKSSFLFYDGTNLFNRAH